MDLQPLGVEGESAFCVGVSNGELCDVTGFFDKERKPYKMRPLAPLESA